MPDIINENKLFADFASVSVQEWKQKMEQDLKGTPFEKLVWNTIDGVKIKPFYTSEDLGALEHLKSEYGSPFMHSNFKQNNDWDIRQDILVESIEKANEKALKVLNLGATSLAFILPENLNLDQQKFSRILKGIYLDCIHISFICHKQSHDVLSFLIEEIKTQNIHPGRIYGFIETDPLGYFSRHGIFAADFEDEISNTAIQVFKASASFPNVRVLGINGNIFHNAGGSAVQELAFSLSIISDYINLLNDKGIQPEQTARNLQMNLAVGPVYFMEIAKIRAARFLFYRLVKSWNVDDEKALRTYIHTTTSEWSQTVYDPYVNMLRSTTEGMSAVIAGADSLSVTPFDNAFRKSTKFSERIARNTQIILKEEAYLDKVIDPSAGSYFIESLTNSLIEESWKLFLEIEEAGGYLKAFRAGIIQKMIKETAAQRDMNIANRKEILLGTNQYANPLDTLPEDFEKDIAFPSSVPVGKTIAEPLKKYRGSAAFEEMRIHSEASRPKVFLLTTGDLTWRKARASFSSNFFACAGFSIIDNPGFETIDEGIKTALESKAEIVVLCSSDANYTEIAAPAVKGLKGHSILVVAGYPKDSLEELKKAGVEHFIHLKSNVLEDLVSFQKLIDSKRTE